MINQLILILGLLITYVLSVKWFYKLIILLLAAINENPDRVEKITLLRLSKQDKLWNDVVKELKLEEHK